MISLFWLTVLHRLLAERTWFVVLIELAVCALADVVGIAWFMTWIGRNDLSLRGGKHCVDNHVHKMLIIKSIIKL